MVQNMNRLKQLLSLIILVIFIQFSASQRFRGCDSNAECILLSQCPQMIDLLRSGNRENHRIVRNSICGFQKRKSLVCCPKSSNIETSTTEKPLLLANNEHLLPKLCGRPLIDDKIIGGKPAPIGAYPWMAAMGYTEPRKSNLQFICSGSIISERYILTAAHCVDRSELGRKKLAAIRVGDWDLASEQDCETSRAGVTCAGPYITAGIEEVKMHPQYDKRARSSDDIALVRLNVSLSFNRNNGVNIQPICLPSNELEVRSLIGKQQAVAAGWGLTEHGNSSNIMLRVTVPFVEPRLCQERYGNRFVGNQICVGGEGGFDTCSGDSGGPLVIHAPRGPPFTQVGVVSYGPFPCGLSDFPGVYTDVKQYKSWIVQTIRP